jgi:hypothetical protein
MLWQEFFRAAPHLREALNYLMEKNSREIAMVFGEEPLFEDEQEVDPDQLLPLLVCNQIKTIEEHHLEAIRARQSWTRFASTVSDGRDVITYLNKAGEIAEVPTPFIDAYLAGRPLDCRIVEDKTDSGRVRIVRGGVVEAVLPKSLLHFLTELQQRNTPRNP